MALAEPVPRRWSGLCIVAAPGPSLTEDVAEQCRGHRCIAVNDAHRRLPWADVLYAADGAWWNYHNGCPEFAGEKWMPIHERRAREILPIAKRFRLRLVEGIPAQHFSFDAQRIHYGKNSGFQAINLAILFGADPIVLVGFDFRLVDNERHFFGKHPHPLPNTGDYPRWLKIMRDAARRLPPSVNIVNCTPGSALNCFPMAELREVLNGSYPGDATGEPDLARGSEAAP